MDLLAIAASAWSCRSWESIEALYSLGWCQHLELEVFGYAIIIKNSIARDEIVHVVGQGIPQMNEV